MMRCMFLAFTIDQVNALAGSYVQTGRIGTVVAYGLWETQHVLLRYLSWTSWEGLQGRIAGLPPDT